MNSTKKLAMILIIIGAINWGLVWIGMLIGKNFNLVNLLLGSVPTIEAIIYILVWIAAIYKLSTGCKKCDSKK